MAMTAESTQGARCRDSGFTLLELLVVLGIMAVVVAVVVPQFEDIGRGSKMRAAVNELRSTISLARQWAIANREDVYIVLPDDMANVYAGLSTNEHTKALRSYALYSASRGYIKDWTYLPSGIFFVDQHNSQQSTRPAPCIVATKNVFRSQTLYSGLIPFPATNNTTKTLNALRMTPQGWAVTTSGASITDNEFYLVEAVALDGTAGKVVNLVWKQNPVVWQLRVNPMTGIIRTIDCSQQ